MLLPHQVGPKERWQSDLEQLNRDGLIYLVGIFIAVLKYARWIIPISDLEGWIHDAKSAGKSFAAMRRHQRYQADPDKYIDEVIRRSRAAKKSARRRKRNRRP
jgi:hypothetical protein